VSPGAERRTFPLLQLRRGVGVFGRERTSTHRGSGDETAGSRAYRPGDNMRAIDWAASARLSSARDTDEFVVREQFAESSLRGVVFVDRGPSMCLSPPGLPWLRKPAAVSAAGQIIVDSVLAAQGLAGYLDFAEPPSPRWLPPRRPIDAGLIRDRELQRPTGGAPEDTVAEGVRHLVRMRADVPPGTFVFVLSDFLQPPPSNVWALAAGLGWDLVPVILQDPVWEQSFPDVAGPVLPFATPDGRATPARLSRAGVDELRRTNEERLAGLLDGFAEIGIEPVLLSSDDPDEILAAFLRWHRRRRERLARQ
jgi:uncharacterized protein (DUF58 family)